MTTYIKNKYTRWYFAIIQQAQARCQGRYLHYIISPALGGSNSKENQVKLTRREQQLCYRLLPHMCANRRDYFQICAEANSVFWRYVRP